MSTTASIGLNQTDYITINRTESSTSTAGASTTANTEASSTKSQPSPSQNEVTSSNERLSAALPSQDSGTLLSASEERQKTVEESELLVNHKSESAKNKSGQTGLTTPRGHVTGEAAATKGISVKGDGAMASSSSKGAPSGGEVQLPAKQALAVLSNVSKSLLFILVIFFLSFCW